MRAVSAAKRSRACLYGLLAAALGLGGVSFGASLLELPSISDGAHGEHHPGKIVWADLVTPDLPAAERFYGALFGWTFKDVRTPHADYAVALADDHAIGGLLQRAVPAGEHRQSAWLTFIAVRDVDVARRNALEHGAKTVSEPKSYAGRGRQAVFSDPEGAVFAVVAAQGGDPADFLAAPGEWIWSALLANEVEHSAAFYQTLFGYEVFDVPSDDGVTHLVFATDDYARASANSLPGGAVRRHPHWLNFIRVDDTVAAVRKAQALGGRILVQPHEDRHGGRSAVIADPAGAPIGVMEWPDAESKTVLPK